MEIILKFIVFSGALEAHFVHYKEEYNDVPTAATHSDGLAVVGVIFVVINSAINAQVYENLGFCNLFNNNFCSNGSIFSVHVKIL